MKHSFLFAIFFFVILFDSTAKQSQTDANEKHPTSKKSLPRITIAGISIESSTFSPAHTDEAAFHAQYGKDVLSRYPFFAADSPIETGNMDTNAGRPRITRRCSNPGSI